MTTIEFEKALDSFTSEELITLERMIEAEKKDREFKRKNELKNKFLIAFKELEKAGVSVFYNIEFTPIFGEDIVELKNSTDFTFS